MGVYNIGSIICYEGIKKASMNKDIERKDASCECSSCKYKHTKRSDETVANLQSRLNRVIGQLGGIKNMLDDNRYCGDILVQLSAAQSALQSIGHLILKEHMETCMTEGILNGDNSIVTEVHDLMKKLM